MQTITSYTLRAGPSFVRSLQEVVLFPTTEKKKISEGLQKKIMSYLTDNPVNKRLAFEIRIQEKKIVRGNVKKSLDNKKTTIDENISTNE